MLRRFLAPFAALPLLAACAEQQDGWTIVHFRIVEFGYRRGRHEIAFIDHDRVACGRGDPAEIERVVDNRHEEVRGRHHTALGIDLVHRRIITRRIADPQFRVKVLRTAAGQNQQLLKIKLDELAHVTAV